MMYRDENMYVDNHLLLLTHALESDFPGSFKPTESVTVTQSLVKQIFHS